MIVAERNGNVGVAEGNGSGNDGDEKVTVCQALRQGIMVEPLQAPPQMQ